MSWTKSPWNETRRKTSIALLRCTQCTEANWDRTIGCRVRHSSNVATKFPDPLRWQLLQHLAMLSLSTESRERSSRDGMAYGSLIDYENQKIKKTVLSTTVAELFSFMKWFGSWQFLHGLCVDIPCEVANVHMKTDAKNLVTAARTIHLPEQKETIHMISIAKGSLFRKHS